MDILVPGHYYQLDNLDGDGHESLRFVNRGHGFDREGTNNQEVIRALINRVEFLDNEKPWHGNANIIRHLQMALVLHETRHIERLVERNLFTPETEPTGIDGHFKHYNNKPSD